MTGVQTCALPISTKYFDYGTELVRVVGTIKLINRMQGFFWQRFLFNVNIQELIDQDFLCPLEYIDMSIIQQEDIPVNKSQSDFDLEKYEDVISYREREILQAIDYGESISRSVLVFCSSVAQATRFAEMKDNAASVSAKTPRKERDAIIIAFKNHEIKTVFNVGVLTTGFDHPTLDCIVLLRPTRSIALYYQMLGRGVRIAEGKTACKIIDLTSTVKNLGKVETIKLIKRDKWELESETGSWHDRELFNFIFTKKPKEEKPQITVIDSEKI